MNKLRLLVASLLILAGCRSQPAPEPAQTLHGFPELGGAGFCQSPINISSTQTTEGVHQVSFDFMPSEQRIVNTGHTVQVSWDEGSTTTFDGEVYTFRQFHFHTPSEHLIDGVTYPLELHAVHTLEGDEGRYLVVALLFREGAASPFLASFLDAVPEEPEGEVIRTQEIDLRDLDPGKPTYYTYLGSLTTPPYTETVTWVVHKDIHQASRTQIQRLSALEGNNARHIQPLNGRTIESD